MTSRLVLVRLRHETMPALRKQAGLRWTSIERICVEAVTSHLASYDVALPPLRCALPPGIDLTLLMPNDLWQRARRVANPTDLTIGQLCRFAVERFAQMSSLGVESLSIRFDDSELGAGRPTSPEAGHAPPTSARHMLH